jgi:mono/diheme cytochrome c family protein
MRALASALVVLVAGCAGYEPPVGRTQVLPTSSSRAAIRAVELSGGTLAIAGGGRYAAVADPDHDRIWIVDLTTSAIRGKVQFADGSQPQRMVEDGNGKLRVALRGSGKIATVSPSSLAISDTIDACPEVRGLSWNKTNASLQVACAGGELVTIKDGLASAVRPAADLRDVMQVGAKTWVSTFRSAKLMELDANGKVVTEVTLPSVQLPAVEGKPVAFVPAVAWRSIVTSGGKIVTVHQRTVDGDIGAIQVPNAPPSPAYYQNVCSSSIVRSTISVTDNGAVVGSIDVSGVLPIDVAVSPDNNEIAIAEPGSGFVQRVQMAAGTNGVGGGGICAPTNREVARLGEVTGVAYTPQNELIVHTRTPMAVWVMGKSGGERTQQQILLTGSVVESEGHALFHKAAGAIACASCHPEGGDDGHVWTLFKEDVRTQSLAGGVVDTAPFHWDGRLANMKAVVTDTFVGRMGGTEPTVEVVQDLSNWMRDIPRPRITTAAAEETIAGGKAIFNSAEAGCATCHAGERLTNNATMDVGTGGQFQVPSLRGVSMRGPWMHNGCATTLKDRFGPCGGTKHGDTSKLAPAELDLLVAYLETL